MEVNVINFKKEIKSKVSLDPLIFDVDYDNNFMSIYATKMKKKSFIKTSKTKNRSEVSGTTKKPHKQKHTGRARLGSLKSAQCIGGGIVFGPRGLTRHIKLPKKEAALAKKMVLSLSLKNNKLFVIENEALEGYSTKKANQIFSLFGKSVLVIHSENVSDTTLLSTRNLSLVNYVSLDLLTANDLITHEVILLDYKILDPMKEKLYA